MVKSIKNWLSMTLTRRVILFYLGQFLRDCFRDLVGIRTKQRKGSKLVYRKRDGMRLKLRSSWEVTVCGYLDLLNIEYQYETLKIPYVYRGKRRRYYTDFYLRKYNLVIEVKPDCFTKDPMVVAKKEATERSGYRFVFITEDDITSLGTFKKKLLCYL